MAKARYDGLTPDMAAGQAGHVILRTLLSAVLAQAPGVLRNDVEATAALAGCGLRCPRFPKRFRKSSSQTTVERRGGSDAGWAPCAMRTFILRCCAPR